MWNERRAVNEKVKRQQTRSHARTHAHQHKHTSINAHMQTNGPRLAYARTNTYAHASESYWGSSAVSSAVVRVLQLFEQFLAHTVQLRTKINRDNCGRGLVRTETMIVSGNAHRRAKQIACVQQTEHSLVAAGILNTHTSLKNARTSTQHTYSRKQLTSTSK